MGDHQAHGPHRPQPSILTPTEENCPWGPRDGHALLSQAADTYLPKKNTQGEEESRALETTHLPLARDSPERLPETTQA